MRRVPRRTAWTLAIVLAATTPWACSEATDVELLEITGSGVLFGLVFLDLDGDGSLSGGDEPIVGASVVLATSGTSEVVDLATTDSLGAFTLFEVPVGTYRLSLDSTTLGDSLEVLGSDDPITVALGDTSLVILGASFAALSLAEALLAPVGRRVFTSGIALNSRINFGDGQVHFAEDSTFLRALNVERSGVQPGDSVRILGRVVIDNGRPALDEVTPFVLITQAALVLPTETSTGIAATADGAVLDAALVRIRDAEITDTTTAVDGHFHFWANDGSDSIEVVIRDFLGLNNSAFRPDTVIRISQTIGLLSPFDDGTGAVRWRLLPRGGADIILEVKIADISVSLSLDTLQASLGDTVEVTVVAANAGPLTATSVQIQDTIPTAFGFVSSTQTKGSYDPGLGIWDIGDIEAGAADTLHIMMEVTDGSPAIIAHLAESLGLTLEVDGNASNDGSVVLLTIS